MNTDYTLPLLAALACGLIIGVERGWKQRAEADGTRTAGIRTFTLIGTAGGLAAVVADTLSPAIAMVIVAGTMAALIGAFLPGPVTPEQRDATTMAAAIVALLLGLLAGSGQPALAVAGSAVVTLLLASRQQSHRVGHHRRSGGNRGLTLVGSPLACRTEKTACATRRRTRQAVPLPARVGLRRGVRWRGFAGPLGAGGPRADRCGIVAISGRERDRRGPDHRAAF